MEGALAQDDPASYLDAVWDMLGLLHVALAVEPVSAIEASIDEYNDAQNRRGRKPLWYRKSFDRIASRVSNLSAQKRSECDSALIRKLKEADWLDGVASDMAVGSDWLLALKDLNPHIEEDHDVEVDELDDALEMQEAQEEGELEPPVNADHRPKIEVAPSVVFGDDMTMSEPLNFKVGQGYPDWSQYDRRIFPVPGFGQQKPAYPEEGESILNYMHRMGLSDLAYQLADEDESLTLDQVLGVVKRIPNLKQFEVVRKPGLKWHVRMAFTPEFRNHVLLLRRAERSFPRLRKIGVGETALISVFGHRNEDGAGDGWCVHEVMIDVMAKEGNTLKLGLVNTYHTAPMLLTLTLPRESRQWYKEASILTEYWQSKCYFKSEGHEAMAKALFGESWMWKGFVDLKRSDSRFDEFIMGVMPTPETDFGDLK